MNIFDRFWNFISSIFVFLAFVTLIIYLCSCQPKSATMYYIYLEHQPHDPLYITDSHQDAKNYYEQFKPFHSDMYIIASIGEKNLTNK